MIIESFRFLVSRGVNLNTQIVITMNQLYQAVRTATIAALSLAACATASALTVTPTNNADTLVNALIGSGITYTSGSGVFTGTTTSGGLFSAGGGATGIGIADGILLTSGSVANAVGPNNNDGATVNNGLAGTAALNALIPGFTTHDATTLTFSFTSASDALYFDYVFASEEYNEYVGSSYNDVFGFFLDGVNIAKIPGTSTNVSINNVNKTSNPAYYVNNDLTDGPPAYNTQYDGFTKVFTAGITGLSAGAHTISLQIADAGDFILDSGVFIKGGSFSNTPSTVPDAGATLALLGFGLIALASLKRKFC